ncbi:MAG: NAC domain-containing protein [Candidatus Helarchaeota archaeon]
MSKWHKIKKQQARKGSSRSIRRAMRKLQQDPSMNIKEIPNVIEVIIRTSENEIKLENPENVTFVELAGQGRVYQIIGGNEVVEGTSIDELSKTQETKIETEEEKPIEIPFEDVQLVAQQAGVTEEEARETLIKTKGDLAKAIIELKKK